MRLFISQFISGKAGIEIENERKRAIEVVKSTYPNEDIKIVSNFFSEAPRTTFPLWCLGKSIEKLSSADLIYFVKGWRDSRDCRIEFECAIEYGIEFMIEN